MTTTLTKKQIDIMIPFVKEGVLNGLSLEDATKRAFHRIYETSIEMIEKNTTRSKIVANSIERDVYSKLTT